MSIILNSKLIRILKKTLHMKHSLFSLFGWENFGICANCSSDQMNQEECRSSIQDSNPPAQENEDEKVGFEYGWNKQAEKIQHHEESEEREYKIKYESNECVNEDYDEESEEEGNEEESSDIGFTMLKIHAILLHDFNKKVQESKDGKLISLYELENPKLKRRLDLIDRIYNVNEENFQKTAYDLLDYIKEDNGNAAYWYHLIVNCFYIRQLHIKEAMQILQIINNEYHLESIIVSNIYDNSYLALILYRAGFLPYFDGYRFGFDENIPSFDEACQFYEKGTLPYYIKYDDIGMVRELIDKNNIDITELINLPNSDVMTHLFGCTRISFCKLAAFYGSLKCYKFGLINDCAGDDLPYAVASGNKELVKMIPCQEYSLQKCFNIAIKFNRNEIIGLLINKVESEKIEFLVEMMWFSLEFPVTCFNERLFYIFSKILKSIGVEEIFPDHPLLEAAKLQNVEIVNFLVHNKMYLNDMEINFGPLHTACMSGNIDIVKILVQNKVVDVNRKSRVPFLFYSLHCNLYSFIFYILSLFYF